MLVLCAALRSGGRYVYLWLTTVVHGLVVECVSYLIPDIDNFWHAQSMIMLFNRRLPLHIVLLCKFSDALTCHQCLSVKFKKKSCFHVANARNYDNHWPS